MRRASSKVSTLAMLAFFVRAVEWRSAGRSDHTSGTSFVSLEPSVAVAFVPPNGRGMVISERRLNA